MLNAFRSSGRKKGTSILVWILLGLLIIGLTGFGLGGAVSGIASQNVASVGDQKVPRADFVRTMLSQVNRLQQQFGQPITMAQARAFGLDQQVLSQLVTWAALDGAAEREGLSAGDALVRDRLIEIPAFQSPSGGFDSFAYDQFLDRQNQTAAEYEEDLRRGLARSMLQTVVMDGVEMPGTLARTLISAVAEQRGFDTLALGPADLPEPLAEADDATLIAFYEADPEAYTLPERRAITYAALTPAQAAETVEISPEELRAEYESRAASFNTPERRILDAIAFADMDAARAARDRIDAGEIDFDDLATERGLSAQDVSLGLQEATDLSAEARAEVFATTGPGIVGPVTSDLGPALYRVNAVIAARSRSFEDVADELRAELALADAENLIAEEIDPVQDLIFSGATLEEVAAETGLILGTLTLGPGADAASIAGDPAFRADALAAEIGPARDLIDLSEGGIATLRLDEIIPPALQPFEEVRAQVAADWRRAETQRLLVARAEALQAQLNEGRTMAALAEAEQGLTPVSQPPIERGGALPETLPRAVLDAVFDLEPGASTVLSDGGMVYLAQLTQVVPVDFDDPAIAARRDQLQTALDGQLATDLFAGYAQMVTNAAEISVNQTLIDTTLAQYP